MTTAEQFDAIIAKLYAQAEYEDCELDLLKTNTTRYDGADVWHEMATIRAAQWDVIADWARRHGACSGDVNTFEELAKAYRESA